jgi:Immunoglobulin-like domain of bacterial spore germination
MSESFRLDQPRANDLVGNPLLIAGSGGGFEADIAVRVLDGNGQVLVETSVTNTNLTSAWQTRVSLPEPPPTNRGVVQVGPSTGTDEAPRGCPYRCSTAPP